MMKRVVREMKQNLETTKQTKVEIERENTRLRYLIFYYLELKYKLLFSEQIDDLQLEIQLAQSSVKMTNTAPDIETQGNSLFSEVEDQRAKTASELRVLEETYRSKIHRFDKLEQELEEKRNENNELWFKGTDLKN